MLLRVICLFVLLGILVAGLWPFHAPRNEVNWLIQGNGLLFGKHGSIVSAEAFTAGPSQTDSSCSLEAWLEPRRVDSSGTILAFYRGDGGAVPFALRQSLSDLVLEHADQGELNRAKKKKIYVDDVFGHQKRVFVTITSGGLGTTVYADGALVKKSSSFRFSIRDLTGRLIVGNSPTTTDNWSGRLSEVAIYGRELSADEASEHYERLASGKPPGQTKIDSAKAVYLFKEGSGRVAHNEVDSATDLLIPERFFVLQEQFLEFPWDEFAPEWGYWKDVGVNIAGFMPLGFFFYAYFSSLRSIKRPAMITIVFGFAVSLTIEVSQAFLPTRDSGMTDLINNTLGTALGASLCAWIAKHDWFSRAGIPMGAMGNRS